MSFMRAKTATTLQTLRADFRDNILIVGDLTTRVGRRKYSVLGDVREQITNTVAARVATALVEEYERKGRVLEPAAQFLYDAPARAGWAVKQIQQMGAINKDANDPDFFRLFEKACGELITIGTQRNPVTRRPEAVRITTAGATPAEIRIVAERIWAKGRRDNIIGERLSQAFLRMADMMADGERFDESMARHYDAIRRGKRPQDGDAA